MILTTPDNNFSDGFTDALDLFERKPLFEQIMRVTFQAPDENLALALEDKWGNGKSTFVKMMTSEIKLNHDNINVIYFDAYENDYQSDPFISLSSVIYEMVENDKNLTSKFGEKLLSASKKIGLSVLSHTAKFAISTATANLLTTTTIEKASEALAESLTNPLEEYIANKIKSAKNERNNIAHFKETLEEIHARTQKKTLIIIDELDRARPDYALDLLEKIKHLFSVKGFIFLLVVNREQFEKSIECRYGQIDSRLYLNKFIHYWFTLPKLTLASEDVRNGFYQSTLEKYLFSIDTKQKLLTRGGSLVKILSMLLENNGCSLREAERCYSVISVIDNKHMIRDLSGKNFQVSLALICYLKVCNPKLLDDLIFKRITADNMLKNLHIKPYEIDTDANLSKLNSIINYHLLSDSEMRNRRENSQPKDLLLQEIEGSRNERIEYIQNIYNSFNNMRISNF
ncbi:P-loop NTPase fold protein [Enterobacter sp. RHBSTW-00175]|uniref:KAP family P-loop NTPase fold protein n=1 Tax=Enterobacter sp. RHBSTW-00175 TaxID=2742639 RepID=UPI0015EA50C2|nr:P-loop NTPase fold protein [Enterobacter sp. RHBSTW-00175]QMR74690.1 hypothetical protein HV107_03195 [Enterobacter sp. RHBSTW-00175]